MKDIRGVAFAGVVLLSGTLTLESPAEARSSRTDFEVYEVACVLEPGIEWTAGSTLHVRGQMSHAVFYEPETFEVLGQNSVVSNIDQNLVTSQGRASGTFSGVLLPQSTTGTFDGTWRGRFGSEGGCGRGVGHGTGELAGSKIKHTLCRVSSSDVPPELLMILAQPPWTDCMQFGGILHVEGFVLRRGRQ